MESTPLAQVVYFHYVPRELEMFCHYKENKNHHSLLLESKHSFLIHLYYQKNLSPIMPDREKEFKHLLIAYCFCDWTNYFSAGIIGANNQAMIVEIMVVIWSICQSLLSDLLHMLPPFCQIIPCFLPQTGIVVL